MSFYFTIATLLFFGQGTHQIELLSLFVGIDRCSLVVVDQLIESVELSLPNAVQSSLHVDAEVLVTTGSLQRHRVVAHLQGQFSLIKPKAGSGITSIWRNICLNVYNGLLSSMQDISKGSVIKKASQLTNVPYRTLYKIIRNGVKTRKKRSDQPNQSKFKNLNPTTAAKIRNIVYDCYKKRQIPTAEIVHKTLLEKGENCSRRTLQKWLRKIGFRFGTIDKKAAIMESRRLTLHAIKQVFAKSLAGAN
nr:unnamed protein product [Callosobruchus chinensis]